MIEVINYTNKQYEQEREEIICDAYSEVRALLPKLPEKIKLYFGEHNLVVPELGAGGFAYSSDIMTISLDPHFPNPKMQENSLRSTVFHESMHLYQNYTGQGPLYSPLEAALYEGVATVFEREYAGGRVPYGDYYDIPRKNLRFWYKELENISTSEYTNEMHSQWAFYNENLKERWILYKLGTYMVDKVLEANKLGIMDIKDKSAKDLLGFYKKIDKLA